MDTVAVASLRFGPPVRPGTVVIVGLNYHGHARELGVEAPPQPRFHYVPGSAVVGPDDPIVLPAVAPDEVDYEGELVVVIGRLARAVHPDDAWSHIAGLTIGNDVTARDVQLRGPANVGVAKGFETFKPLGPSLLVHNGRFDELALRTLVDGVLRQDSTTADLIVAIPDLIATISRYAVLRPGDVIFTGTPAGVGLTTGSFLRPGQTVAVQVPGIGELVNRVVGPPDVVGPLDVVGPPVPAGRPDP